MKFSVATGTSVDLSIHPSIHTSILPCMYPSIHPSRYPFIQSEIHVLCRRFCQLFINSSIVILVYCCLLFKWNQLFFFCLKLLFMKLHEHNDIICVYTQCSNLRNFLPSAILYRKPVKCVH